MSKIPAALVFATVVSTASAARIVPKVIYGDDDRKEIYQVEDEALRNVTHSTAMLIESFRLHDINASEYQIQGPSFGEEYGLCAEEPFREQTAAGYCSAFLVAPDKIATAGHCITTQNECDSTSFVFGYGLHSADEDVNHVAKSQVFGCKRIIERIEVDSGADYGLIQLDRPAEGLVPLQLASEAVATNDLLHVVGHPSGLPTKVGEGHVRSAAPKDYILTNLDTYAGNSGSAVLRGSDHAVVGILVRGEEDFSYQGGCRSSFHCTNDSCRGEDVTRIHFIAEALKKTK
ncbi:MAG: serine protease [Bdellovibrionota bacterium]